MKQKRVLIFGAGGFGREILSEVQQIYFVVGFLDNDQKRWGKKVDGVSIIGSVEQLEKVDFDEIILGTMALSIVDQLVECGVPREKININYISLRINARINYLRDFAEINQDRAGNYCVAEGGVFQGEFSKIINEVFPYSKLLLFDTFEGFCERDIATENERGFSQTEQGHFGFTSEEIVLKKMKYKQNVEIYKGIFPNTLVNVDSNNQYIFVNLDFDLYNPTLAGLEYFWPRMVRGGVILIHDYYHPIYKAIPNAISDFEDKNKIKILKMPIGDHCSMALIKE